MREDRDDDAESDQGSVRGAEEGHPAPGHGPVGQEPEVHQSVEHPHQHRQGQVFDVPGVPEARPVGQQEKPGQPDEPAAPDGNRCGISDHVRVGQAPGATQCRMDPMPALSKPRLPVPSRLPGCAPTLQTECLRLQPRNPAASTTLRGYQSKLDQSD